MKKLFIALFAIIGIVAGASAQSTELFVSYGGYTQMDATDCHDGGSSVNTAWGALNAGINFRIAPNLWIGPSYTFSSTTRKHNDDNHFYYHAIMLNGRYNYYRNSIVTMYGKLGLGTIITHETWPDDSKNYGHFGFQFSPVCAQVGINNTLTMFGELGFGAQGLLQVGLKINL
ncbi:MAG: porin family protein [Muribaculum sp.]|nr:porin family protein [Muribaculaceae bacterium]MCM1081495.1 porin family protein [Muribaculum sp.]